MALGADGESVEKTGVVAVAADRGEDGSGRGVEDDIRDQD